MNFKTMYFVALLTISVLLLSGCEVYQTLYKTTPQEPEAEFEFREQVVRVEGADANDPKNLEKMVYAAATPTEHDPFKVGKNPLGPFEMGKPLGFTLGQWLAASGIGIYSVDDDEAEIEFSFKNLVPNGVYTVWCSRLTFPPNPKIVDKPCGDEEVTENSFKAEESGRGSFSLQLEPLELSTKETATVIAVAYHSDGKTYGASPGDFGLNSHVQIFFVMPPLSNVSKAFQVPIKFINHIDAGLPEQDVFIKLEKETVIPSGAIVVEKEEPMEKEMPKEEVIEEEVMPEEKEMVAEEETPKEMPREKPVVIVIQETELVNLVPRAEDPDKDTSLVFTFTSPLDESGEWQTTYGDAGEYTVTVTASDGELTTTKDVLIIVNKKEEPPTIDSARPIESGLVIEETQAIEFDIVASDLNKDPLSYTWKLDGIDVDSERKYTYQTTHEDSGTHTIKIDISDGFSSTSKIWSVDVKNVNREPVLEQIDDMEVKETDKVIITALATDDDKDAITYTISDERFTQEDNVFTWQTDYDSAGTHKVIVTASDAQDTTEQEFTITVENINRAPVITDILQKK